MVTFKRQQYEITRESERERVEMNSKPQRQRFGLAVKHRRHWERKKQKRNELII